jgi:hypothetical protein
VVSLNLSILLMIYIGYIRSKDEKKVSKYINFNVVNGIPRSEIPTYNVLNTFIFLKSYQ